MQVTFLVDDFQWGASCHLDKEGREMVWFANGDVIEVQLELKNFDVIFNGNSLGRSLLKMEDRTIYEVSGPIIGAVPTNAFRIIRGAKRKTDIRKVELMVDCGVPVRTYAEDDFARVGETSLIKGKNIGLVGELFGIVEDDSEGLIDGSIRGKVLGSRSVGKNDWLHEVTIETKVSDSARLASQLYRDPFSTRLDAT